MDLVNEFFNNYKTPNDQNISLNERKSPPKYIPFKAPDDLWVTYEGDITFTDSKGKELEAAYSIPAHVYWEHDEIYNDGWWEFDDYDYSKLEIKPRAGCEDYLLDIIEKIKDTLENDESITEAVEALAAETCGEMADNWEGAYEAAVDQYYDEMKLEQDD